MKRKNSKKAPPPPITEAEWAVMEMLWEQAPRTSQEVVASLERERGWKRATVLTLLSRLAAKGAIVTEPQGNRFLYSPAFERAECVSMETSSLLGRLFGGALQPLLAHLAEHHPLTKKDIAELKALLDDIEPKA